MEILGAMEVTLQRPVASFGKNRFPRRAECRKTVCFVGVLLNVARNGFISFEDIPTAILCESITQVLTCQTPYCDDWMSELPRRTLNHLIVSNRDSLPYETMNAKMSSSGDASAKRLQQVNRLKLIN